MTPEQRISRAEQAKRVLEDPLVQEALTHLKTSTQAIFFDLPANAAQEREFLHLLDKARQQFEQCFTAILIDGEVTRRELLAERGMKEHLADIKRRVFG
jgi:hypothetical protein